MVAMTLGVRSTKENLVGQPQDLTPDALDGAFRIILMPVFLLSHRHS